MKNVVEWIETLIHRLANEYEISIESAHDHCRTTIRVNRRQG